MFALVEGTLVEPVRATDSFSRSIRSISIMVSKRLFVEFFLAYEACVSTMGWYNSDCPKGE